MTASFARSNFFIFLLVLTFLVCGLLLPGVKVAKSATVEELQAELTRLIAELTALQAQVIQNQEVIQASPSFEFTRNLTLGSRGEDVRELQKILNTNIATAIASSGAGSPGNETDYFGVLTKNAVVRFQEIYFEDVLLPAGLLSGTGFVGPSTRVKLNEVRTSTVVTPLLTQGPVVLRVTPEKGTNGSSITIFGKNFHPTNNTVGIGGILIENVPSADGTSLSVLVSSNEHAQLFGGSNGTVQEQAVAAVQNISLLTETQRNEIMAKTGFINDALLAKISPSDAAKLTELINNVPNDFKPYFQGKAGTIPLGIIVETPVGISNETILFNLELLP